MIRGSLRHLREAAVKGPRPGPTGGRTTCTWGASEAESLSASSSSDGGRDRMGAGCWRCTPASSPLFEPPSAGTGLSFPGGRHEEVCSEEPLHRLGKSTGLAVGRRNQTRLGVLRPRAAEAEWLSLIAVEDAATAESLRWTRRRWLPRRRWPCGAELHELYSRGMSAKL